MIASETVLSQFANSMEFAYQRKQQGQEVIWSSYNDVNNMERMSYCIQLIHEFLVLKEFQSTTTVFLEECVKLGYPNTEHDVLTEKIKEEHIPLLLDCFQKGNFELFFQSWETCIPPRIQDELPYRQLSFYLHVHFAVLPLRNHTPNAEEELVKSMKDLRAYLETKGADFSNEPEFLPYFALPFINNPGNHPSFKELFQNSWVENLEKNLVRFLEDHCWGDSVAPKLVHLCTRKELDNYNKMYSPGSHICNSYKSLRQKFRRLQKDYRKLIGIAAELTAALESSVRGESVDLKATLNSCTKIFPELFSQCRSAGSESNFKPEEIIRKSIQGGSEISTLQKYFDLDFKKVKSDLSCGSMKTRMLLIQALRWRITQSTLEERDQVINSYIRHDILGLSQLHPLKESVLGCFKLPCLNPHPLQQAVARLVNTLASLRSGRDYLCSCLKLLDTLISCLLTNDIKLDPVALDMVLATLQKLSLRHNQRVNMIEAGLVEWVVDLLKNAYSFKAYTLEYSIALLMNLCLHNQAKERCVPIAPTILKLLMDLLTTEIMQVVPYVNGTLYSLLGHPTINEEATKMNLATVLEYHLQRSQGEMYRQLEYILKLHRGESTLDHSMHSEYEEEEDTEEIDLMEEELDADDPVKGGAEDLTGEELLNHNYRLVFPVHGVVHPSSYCAELLTRPTTPRLRSPTDKFPSRQVSVAEEEMDSYRKEMVVPETSEVTSVGCSLPNLNLEAVECQDDPEKCIATGNNSPKEFNNSEGKSGEIAADVVNEVSEFCWRAENPQSSAESISSNASKIPSPLKTRLGQRPPQVDTESATPTATEESANSSDTKDGGDEEYSAFCARPRIARTPPQSAKY